MSLLRAAAAAAPDRGDGVEASHVRTRDERDRLLARAGAIVAEHRILLERLADGDASGFAGALRDHLAQTHGVQLGTAGTVLPLPH